MDEAPSTRASLLIRLRDPADERAWSEFTEIYGPLVHRLARRRGLQEADAQDLAQEVFRAVARAIERYDPDPDRGSFRGWLSRIARNLIINLLAARRRQPQGTGRHGRPPPAGGASRPGRRGLGLLRGRVPPTPDRVGGRADPRRILRAGLAGVLAGRRRGKAAEGGGRGPGDDPGHGLSVQEPGRRPDPARDRAIWLGIGRGFLGDSSDGVATVPGRLQRIATEVVPRRQLAGAGTLPTGRPPRPLRGLPANAGSAGGGEPALPELRELAPEFGPASPRRPSPTETFGAGPRAGAKADDHPTSTSSTPRPVRARSAAWDRTT